MKLALGSLSLFLAAGRAQTATAAPSFRVETFAGSSLAGDGGPATGAQIGSIYGVVADHSGNLYLSDTDGHRVRKIAPNGIITTIAGTGAAGFSGDGGPGPAAQLNTPYGLAVDLAGNVFIADLGNSRVRRVAADGTITTYAGGGASGATGDGGPAVKAQLLGPRNVAVDAAGIVYISEFSSHRVRRVGTDGIISTFAGTGAAGYSGEGGAPSHAQLNFPAGLALDRSGALYIADSQNGCIRKVANGTIVTALGRSPEVTLLTPTAVAVDLLGNIYVADLSNTVHVYSPDGKWTLVAGNGAPKFMGDGGPAKDAGLAYVHELAVDLAGNLDIADDVRLRQVNPALRIATIAGDAYQHSIGDGGPANAAQLHLPSAVSMDSAGNLYIADAGTQRIRQVQRSGIIGTFAGTGNAGYTRDGIAATAADLNSPFGVTVDPNGNILIADSFNHRVRQVTGGVIATFAGTGTSGTGEEGLAPAKTQLRGPRAVCGDRSGTVYVVDTSNHRVLRGSPGGNLTVAAGNGAPGDEGDGGPARLAELNQPGACTVDVRGNLYIADTLSHRIRKVTTDGVIATIAGTGKADFGGDEGPATAAALNTPRGVAVDGNGAVYIADTGNNRIRLITADGVIHTVAGRPFAGFSGDDGPALSAVFNQPQGVFLDGSGNLYIADSANNRVRRLVPSTLAPVLVAPEVTPPISVVNAASMTAGPIAPGEVVTVFGTGIGPVTGVAGSYLPGGVLANMAGGAEIRFDGVPAPVFYAQSSQVNVQAPYTLSGRAVTHVEAFYLGQSVATADVPVTSSAPALFGPAVNQDGSLNSQTNPAPRLSVVTIYGTGEGLTTGANISGMPAGAPFAQPQLRASLTIAGVAPQLLYLGSAPGLIGMLQINALVPGGFVQSGAAAVQLTVGGVVSPALTIWVQ